VKRFLITAFVLASVGLFGQELQQRVFGRVEEKFLQPALSGANVTLSRDSIHLGTSTDNVGNFIFESVNPGRYVLRVTYTGYQSWQQEVLVVVARPSEVIVALEETSTELESIEISSRTTQSDVQSVTIEKTLRVPANFFDPVT
jgi:iron complex outermembrane receptor protein